MLLLSFDMMSALLSFLVKRLKDLTGSGQVHQQSVNSKSSAVWIPDLSVTRVAEAILPSPDLLGPYIVLRQSDVSTAWLLVLLACVASPNRLWGMQPPLHPCIIKMMFQHGEWRKYGKSFVVPPYFHVVILQLVNNMWHLQNGRDAEWNPS